MVTLHKHNKCVLWLYELHVQCVVRALNGHTLPEVLVQLLHEFFEFIIGIDAWYFKFTSFTHIKDFVEADGCFDTATTKTALHGLKFYLLSFSEEERNSTNKKTISRASWRWCSTMYVGRGTLGTCRTCSGCFLHVLPWSNSSIGPYMASARLISSTVTGQFKMWSFRT